MLISGQNAGLRRMAQFPAKSDVVFSVNNL